jgi:CRP-like cAMP-binding protein
MVHSIHPLYFPLSANRLLTALPAADLALIRPHLRTVPLAQGTMLQEQDTPVEHVYFPLSGAISLVSVMESGEVVQTAIVGREGAVGAFGGFAFTRAIVQLPGTAEAIPVGRFQAAVAHSNRIRDLILRFKNALLGQVQQTAACNALHPLEARLARWLLQTSDRAGGPMLPLRQDFMAQMLAVRRTTVTLIASQLKQTGLISYQRGHVAILDRPKLEEMACECYATNNRRTEAVFLDQDLGRGPHKGPTRADELRPY